MIARRNDDPHLEELKAAKREIERAAEQLNILELELALILRRKRTKRQKGDDVSINHE